MVETVRIGEKVIALIVRNSYKKDGVNFVTPEDYSQQLAYMHHPPGKIITPHMHYSVTRQVHYTKEVLIIKKGKLRVDFYDNSEKYIESRVLLQGDVILLSTAGHGFEVLEELEMIEVKQGPYVGNSDKRCFKGVSLDQIRIKE